MKRAGIGRARSPGWTVGRASGLGILAGLAAILLSFLYRAWPETLGPAYLTALAATALCGLSILLMTMRDTVRNPRRGSRVRPLRAFDVALGVALLGPATWTAWHLWPELGMG